MPLPFWAKPRFVLFVILLYLTAHFAIRMAMGRALGVDDSDQAIFSQFYAWAYRYKAPPLFVWMLAALGQVIPVNAFATGLLRYSLLGITFGFVYLVARQLLADPRLSALSVYSFAAINTFAEASHRNLAHTTAMAALLAVAWYVFVRLAAAPRLGWYLALGAIFGLGMLAKWNFALFALSLPLACLLSREGRRLVITWKIVPAGLVAAALVMPTFVATMRMGALPDEDVHTVLSVETGNFLVQRVSGTLNLLDTALVYSLPLLPIVVIVFGLPLWRGLRRSTADGGLHPSYPNAALLGATIAIGLAFFWGLVLILGATEFRVRYLYPALLILPVWLFMVIERGRPSDRAINIFALIMAALVVIVGVKRMATEFTTLLSCGLCLEKRPFMQLAAQLGEAGYRGGGTILAGDIVGGNLRVTFPKARIIDPAYPRANWPAPFGEDQCLVVWEISGGDAGGVPTPYASYLTDVLHGRLDAPHSDGTVSAPMLTPAPGDLRLAYRLYQEPNGDCR